MFYKYYKSLERFDKRSGFITLGLPSILVMISILITGTFIVDKQLECRYLREHSLRKRELTLKEEHDEMLRMLSNVTPAGKLDNSVPIPSIEE